MDRYVQPFLHHEQKVAQLKAHLHLPAHLPLPLQTLHHDGIAFALVVGIQPQWGVDTTLITTFVVGIFGGRPGSRLRVQIKTFETQFPDAVPGRIVQWRIGSCRSSYR